MPAINSKPTSEEIDQAHHVHNDVNDYLEYLSDIIQSEIDSEDSDDDDDEELSPIVSQFLQDYKEYVSSSNIQSSIKYRRNSRLPTRFWRYSETFKSLQLLSPDLLCDQKLCETQLNCNAQVSPLFSTFFSSEDDKKENEKLLTNEASPSVTLLKSQLEKDARIRENNYMIVRSPMYIPEEEKKFVFVVKKSTDVIVAATTPTLVVEPPKQEPVKEETVDNNSAVENEKSGAYKEKPQMSAINYFVSSFLASAKLGFSRSQLNTLETTRLF